MKTGNGVCGAAGEKGAGGARTRQKGKKQEMTCAERQGRREMYTSKRKKQEMACAERLGRKGHVHVKEEKAGNDVCGATPSSAKLLHCTRQKEKNRK